MPLEEIGFVAEPKILRSFTGTDFPSYDMVFIVSSSEIINLPSTEMKALVHDLITQATNYTLRAENDII